MNRKAKILSIYRAVKEKRNIFSLISAEAEEDDLVKIILQLVKMNKICQLASYFIHFKAT